MATHKTMKATKISYLYQKRPSTVSVQTQFPHHSLVHLSTLLQSQRKKSINKQMLVLSSRLNARQYNKSSSISAEQNSFFPRQHKIIVHPYNQKQIRTAAPHSKRQKLKENDDDNFFLSQIVIQQPLMPQISKQDKTGRTDRSQRHKKRNFYLRRLQFTTFVKNQKSKSKKNNIDSDMKQIVYEKQQQNKFRNLKPQLNNIYFTQLKRLDILPDKPKKRNK